MTSPLAEPDLEDIARRSGAIFGEVPVGLCFLGTDLRYRMVNEWIAALNGIPVDEHLGRNPEEIVPNVASLVLPKYRRLLQTGEPGVEHIVVAETPSQPGVKRVFLHSYFPVREGDRIVGITSLVQDVTELRRSAAELEERIQDRTAKLEKANAALADEIARRRTAETALAVSEQQARAVLESVADGVVTIDASGAIKSMNPASEAIFGCSAADLVGHNVSFLIPETEGRGLDVYLAALTACADSPVLEAGPHEVRARRIDGSEFPIELNVGEVVPGQLFVGSVRDITEREQARRELEDSRARMRRMLDALPVAVLYLDPYLLIRSFNAHFLEWHGISAQDLEGTPLADFLGPAAFERVHPRLASALSGHQSRYVDTVDYATLGPRVVEATYVPDINPNDEVVGVHVFLRDRTEAREAERKLQEAQRMEAVGQLTGGIAHDFNNLLTVVIGSLELMARSKSCVEQAGGLIATALGASERGAALTHRLLAFARKQPLQPVGIDLSATIRGLAGLLEQTVREHIAIELVLPADPTLVVLDPAMFESALINLAANARDSMPSGGQLRIEARISPLERDEVGASEPGEYVRVSMSDNGAGMSPTVMEKACEPFFTTKVVGKGSGLGLSMVHGFVGQSGGWLEILSEPGQGTTVLLYFPLELECQEESISAMPQPQVPDGVGHTILVVEDDGDVRRLVMDLLAALGHYPLESSDSKSAFAALDRAEVLPDLVLCDFILPGEFSGLELVQEIGQRYPGVDVLLMSGYSGLELPPGCALLKKPFQIDDLDRAVVSAISSRSS